MKTEMKSVIITVAAVLFAGIASAAVTVPYTIDFECGEELTLDPDLSDWQAFWNCNNQDITGGGGWAATNNGGEGWKEVLVAAQNPASSGSYGLRYPVGYRKNDSPSGISFTLDQRYTELWIRWYMRFADGYRWYCGNDAAITTPNDPPVCRTQMKLIYFDMDRGTSGAWQAKLHNWNNLGYLTYADGSNRGTEDGGDEWVSWGWDDLNATGDDVVYTWNNSDHKLGDGQWHCFEIHFKYETSAGAGDGVFEFWIDDVKRYGSTSVEYGATDGILDVEFPANEDTPYNTPSNSFVDFDDIAFSATGYIGPIDATQTYSLGSLSGTIQ